MQSYYTPDMPNTSGIYQITCTATGKIYIGSSVNLRMRRKCHFGDLQQQKHHNAKLQRAWNKYGGDAFIFEILELILIREMLVPREQYWFDKLKPFDENGFNIAHIAGSTMGRVCSIETREKIGSIQRGRPGKNRGRKMTPEQLSHHIRMRTGVKQSDEQKQKAAQSRIGTHRSPETRERMRIAALGHAPTNAKTYILTSPEGEEFTVTGLRPFCREHDLNSSSIVQVAGGHTRHHKGWTARYAEISIE